MSKTNTATRTPAEIAAVDDHRIHAFALVKDGSADKEVEYDRCSASPIDEERIESMGIEYLGYGTVSRYNDTPIAKAHTLFGQHLFFYRNNPRH